MSQFVRCQDSQQRKRKGNSHHKPVPILQRPLPRPVIQIGGKEAQVPVERVLHVGTNAERGKDRCKKQERVQPVAPLGRVNYNDRNLPSFRIKNVIFLRKRLDVRHGNE